MKRAKERKNERNDERRIAYYCGSIATMVVTTMATPRTIGTICNELVAMRLQYVRHFTYDSHVTYDSHATCDSKAT